MARRCFWDADGCERWHGGELTVSSNTRLMMTRGQMWSVIESVECCSSGQHAVQLITSPQDVLWDFLYSADYHTCLVYL